MIAQCRETMEGTHSQELNANFRYLFMEKVGFAIVLVYFYRQNRIAVTNPSYVVNGRYKRQSN